MSKIVKLPPSKKHRRFQPAHKAVQELNDYAADELFKARQYHAALAVGKRAIYLTPNSPALWSNIGIYFFNLRQYQEAEAALLRAISIDPNYPLAHGNLGLVYSAMRDWDRAQYHLAKTLELKPGDLDSKWNRSMLNLSMGKWKEGFEEYDTRIVRNRDKSYPTLPHPLWNGQDPKGKTLYISPEQGIGDTILFSRFLPWVAGLFDKVYMCCHPDMTRLLWEFREFIHFIPEGVPVPEADYAVFLASLPRRYGCTLENIPDDPGLIRKRAEIQHRLQKAEVPVPPATKPEPFKVGICWSGNPKQERNEERTIPFELFLQLTANPAVWLYSFQVGPGQQDIRRFGAEDLVMDLGPQIAAKGLSVTASALLQMDLVITSCTSIAHLAGSLGLPTWVMLCYDPYWIWGSDRDDSLWYPSIRLFRQQVVNDWQQVVRQVEVALQAHLAEPKDPLPCVAAMSAHTF